MGSLKSLRNRRSGIDARHFSLWRMKINSLAFVEHQCPTYNSSLFFQSFLNIKQDSRLRGNDGVSYFQAAFAMPKGSLKRLRYGNGKSGYGGAIRHVLFQAARRVEAALSICPNL